MSTHTMRPTLQTVPESLPTDHVTQPPQATGISPTNNASSGASEKPPTATILNQPIPVPVVNLKPRSSSSRVSWAISQRSPVICLKNVFHTVNVSKKKLAWWQIMSLFKKFKSLWTGKCAMKQIDWKRLNIQLFILWDLNKNLGEAVTSRTNFGKRWK